MSRRRNRRRKQTRLGAQGERQRWIVSLLRSFVAKHGWAKLRPGTIVGPGIALYAWVNRRRREYRIDRIDDEVAAECERIPGWTWEPGRDAQRRKIDELRAIVRARGWNVLIEPAHEQLHNWAIARRFAHRHGTLPKWIARALEAIPGWSWDPLTKQHARSLRELRGYVARNGWSAMTRRTISRKGVAIGEWVNNIRAFYRRGQVPQWLVGGLESVPGWTWEPAQNRRDSRAARVAAHVRQHGWESVRRELVVDGFRLGEWVHNCRGRYRSKTISPAMTALVEAIPGWSWSRAGPRTRASRRQAVAAAVRSDVVRT